MRDETKGVSEFISVLEIRMQMYGSDPTQTGGDQESSRCGKFKGSDMLPTTMNQDDGRATTAALKPRAGLC